MSRPGRYETGLERNRANFAPLTPLTFLDWSAQVYPEHPAVVHGRRRYTWRQTAQRCRRLASALADRGVGQGDTVAVVAANTPEMVEAHFGIPMTGAVLNTINTRLDAGSVAAILDHGEADVLLTDREFSPVVGQALARASRRPLVIDIDDPEYGGPGERLGELDYEGLLDGGDPGFVHAQPGRRVAGDLAELHLGHHRRPQGGRLPPPRRAPQRRRQHPHVGDAAARGVPVDAADVPLQRLVLPLDGGRRLGDERVPAAGGSPRSSST